MCLKRDLPYCLAGPFSGRNLPLTPMQVTGSETLVLMESSLPHKACWPVVGLCPLTALFAQEHWPTTAIFHIDEHFL